MQSSKFLISFCLMGLILSFISGAPVSFAASGDADGTFTVDMTKIEISSDSGTTYTTIFEGNTSVNIASADAGAAISSLIQDVTLKNGLYDCVRATVGDTLLMRGYVNDPDAVTTLYTDGDSNDDAFTGTAGLDSPGGDYAVSAFTIDAVQRTQVTCGLSINIDGGGAVPTVVVNIDANGVLTQSGDTPSIGSPNIVCSSR